MKYTCKINDIKLTIKSLNGKWGLFITDFDGIEDCYETNKNINILVNNVAAHAPTGCDDYDDLDDPNLPMDLSQWEKD